ncbi:spermidine synthase [Phytomonospora sp. NPDC050363]|uniref:spermidine synthase n=1 Tax=Phytomonospora sp. NPDC050363 TaxID=3155642 RepID=UPI0033DEB730
MGARFEELDFRPTPMGEISLRRRREPVTGIDILEVKLGEEFLMSSLFTVAEVEVARLALAELGGAGLSVAVGGLGLGYTAKTVLDDPRVGDLIVIDAIGEVIGWHEDGLIPIGAELTADPRCRLLHGDFFALAASGDGLDPQRPGHRFDAVIVDIDHSPRHLLHPRHAAFYEPEGVARLAGRLSPGGVFSLWSNDPPDEDYTAVLASAFGEVKTHVVRFANPLQGGESANTVYTARSSHSSARGTTSPDS